MGRGECVQVSDGAAPDSIKIATHGSSIIWDQGETKHTASSDDVLSLLGVATFTAPQVVELSCRTLSGTVLADDARVTAIKVGALHGSTPVD